MHSTLSSGSYRGRSKATLLRAFLLGVSLASLPIFAVRGLLGDVSNPRFVRGDSSGDRAIDIEDAVLLVTRLFQGSPIPCDDAADANDDGAVNLTDGVHLLSYLFTGGSEPSEPFPFCGVDPTRDFIGCELYMGCGTSEELVNSVGMVMIYVPPGEFLMGSPPHEEGRETNWDAVPDSRFDEWQHRVALTCGYYMSSLEVTQGEFEAVMGTNPATLSCANWAETAPDRAAICVTWTEAMQFCQRLTDREGLKEQGEEYRLPTEAEWEFACRAGTSTRYWFGDLPGCPEDPGRTDLCPSAKPYGVKRHEAFDHPQRGGKYLANPWGFYDMHANVGEWCLDWFGSYPREEFTVNPAGPKTGQWKVARGNAVFTILMGRSAARGFGSDERAQIGFRIVRSPCRPHPVTRP